MIKRVCLYVFVILGILVGGYTYSWYLGAHKVEDLIAAQIKSLEAKGHRIAHDGISTTGFPFGIHIDIKNPHFEIANPIGITASIHGTLKVCSYFWKPEQVTLYSADALEVKAVFLGAQDSLIVKAEKGLTAHTLLSDPLKGLKAQFENVKLAGLKAQRMGISININQGKQDKNGYQIKLEQLDPGSTLFVGMPQIIESVLVKVSVKGLIDVNSPIEKSIKTWYQSDGVVDVDTLQIHWGDLKIESNGTFSLDPNMQPLAAFAAEIYGLDTLLTKLGEAGFIHKNLLPIIRTSLHFLKDSSGDQKKKSIYHKVAITLQDRELSIGSVPIAKLPMVHWSFLGG